VIDTIASIVHYEGVINGSEEKRTEHGFGDRSADEAEFDRPQFRQDAQRCAVDAREQGGDGEIGALVTLIEAQRRGQGCARGLSIEPSRL
jgi:hypothetical protein